MLVNHILRHKTFVTQGLGFSIWMIDFEISMWYFLYIEVEIYLQTFFVITFVIEAVLTSKVGKRFKKQHVQRKIIFFRSVAMQKNLKWIAHFLKILHVQKSRNKSLRRFSTTGKHDVMLQVVEMQDKSHWEISWAYMLYNKYFLKLFIWNSIGLKLRIITFQTLFSRMKLPILHFSHCFCFLHLLPRNRGHFTPSFLALFPKSLR